MYFCGGVVMDGLDPELSTWKKVFEAKRCFLCKEDLGAGDLERHFKSRHLSGGVSAVGLEECQKFIDESVKGPKALLREFREKWSDYCEPREVATGGGGREVKYFCEICNVLYTTRDMEAMELHCANHAADLPAKIGKAVDGRELYWPEENVFARFLGRRFHGTQAAVDRIVIPQSMRALGEQKICCRKCLVKTWEFKDGEPIRTLANRLCQWKKHEASCSGAKSQ